MLLALFLCVLAAASLVALADWRRGWWMAVLCGVLQDPVRKMTPGAPVALTFSIVVIYAVIVFAAQRTLFAMYADLIRRFGRLYLSGAIFGVCLVVAAMTGLMTFGIGLWQVPALSLFIYCVPVPALLLGYAYNTGEESMLRFFRFFAILTSIALIGTLLEYLDFDHASLGLVGMPGRYIRHLPGLQIRMLSGFYRAPDIMAWHAAMLTAISAFMTIRGGLKLRSWPWMVPMVWGFLNCLISGRRKALYMIAVFGLVLAWRYWRRLTTAQVMAVMFVGAALGGVMLQLSSEQSSSVYTTGSVTSRGEVLQRLEGGVIQTVRQFGIMGAGLGTATQGVRHLVGNDVTMGWQEGGLGKLAVELGIPGLIAAMAMGWRLIATLLLVSRQPDEPGSSQLLRVSLLAIVVANVVNFMASAQAYSDAVLTLVTAFLLGALLGTARLDASPPPDPAPQPLPQTGLPAPA